MLIVYCNWSLFQISFQRNVNAERETVMILIIMIIISYFIFSAVQEAHCQQESSLSREIQKACLAKICNKKLAK